jgi:hypothetical protein
MALLKAIKTIIASKTKSFQLTVAFQSIAWPFTNPQALLKKSVPSYDLLSELPLRHRSHNHSSSLPELLPTITLTNTSSITRTRQTEHIKDKAITVAEVFKEALETVTLKIVTVSGEAKTAVDITY